MNIHQKIISFQESLEAYYNLLSDERSHFHATPCVDKKELKSMAKAVIAMLDAYKTTFKDEIVEYNNSLDNAVMKMYDDVNAATGNKGQRSNESFEEYCQRRVLNVEESLADKALFESDQLMILKHMQKKILKLKRHFFRVAK